jgi:hypothetical protein
MSEVGFTIANRQVVTVRLEPNVLQGRDMAGVPCLSLPLQIQLLPGGQKGDGEYTLVRLAGTLRNQPLGDFARFELGPLALTPNPTPYFRAQDAVVELDRLRLRRFEDVRDGRDAHLQVTLSALVWYPAEQRFEVPFSSGFLDLLVPRSHWVDKVLPQMNLSNSKLIEIEFPGGTIGENFRGSYARIEEAEKLFASGLHKQVLTSLRLSFEGLSKSLGFESPRKEFFESLFATAHPEKKEKASAALTALYRVLHLGPHEHETVVTRRDARFALTMAYTVFEYIIPED